jgi:hypothetical protein
MKITTLFAERPQIVDGFMAVPDAPGLGLALRRDTLDEVRRQAPVASAGVWPCHAAESSVSTWARIV